MVLFNDAKDSAPSVHPSLKAQLSACQLHKSIENDSFVALRDGVHEQRGICVPFIPSFHRDEWAATNLSRCPILNTLSVVTGGMILEVLNPWGEAPTFMRVNRKRLPHRRC
jgi:hypothetical protein